MDKFGIFNLLNSLLNLTNGTKRENETPTPPNDEQKSGNILSVLTDLINKNSNHNGTPTAPAKNGNTDMQPPLPLQSKMLSTMNSHDDFIKRVKEKNKG